MNPHARHLAEARAARDAARGVFDARLEQIKLDLSARGVGGRVADRLGEDAKSAFEDALDVASESKGIIAGTIAMLALWFMRQPIIAWIAGMIDHHTGEEKENTDE